MEDLLAPLERRRRKSAGEDGRHVQFHHICKILNKFVLFPYICQFSTFVSLRLPICKQFSKLYSFLTAQPIYMKFDRFILLI